MNTRAARLHVFGRVREPRFQALGVTDQGRRLHITFTLRGGGDLIRVISARDMSRKERARYAQEAEAHSRIRE